MGRSGRGEAIALFAAVVGVGVLLAWMTELGQGARPGPLDPLEQELAHLVARWVQVGRWLVPVAALLIAVGVWRRRAGG